jgi:hypothetical protein
MRRIFESGGAPAALLDLGDHISGDRGGVVGHLVGVIADHGEPMRAELHLLATVTATLRRGSVIAVTVEFDDEPGLWPVAIGLLAVELYVDLRQRDVETLAEIQEVVLERALRPSQLGHVGVQGGEQASAASPTAAACGTDRVGAQLGLVVELREAAMHEFEGLGGREVEEGLGHGRAGDSVHDLTLNDTLTVKNDASEACADSARGADVSGFDRISEPTAPVSGGAVAQGRVWAGEED